MLFRSTTIAGAAIGVAHSPATASTALPTTANDVIVMETTGITTDSINVTAAGADYIGISYDAGTTWTAMTSGTGLAVPATKWPAAGALTKALIKVEETDKATRFVNIFISRA